MVSRKTPLRVVVLSGGTGRTGKHILQAALAQFDQHRVKVVVKPRVRSSRSALKIIESLDSRKSILCHTLVQPEVRDTVVQECHRRNIHSVDLFGPLLTLLNDRLGSAPRYKPGLSYELNKEQFDRLDAVDFTMSHDDGARVDDLENADVVLVGPSRVSKSVTCFCLAYRGVRAANVPLLLEAAPPPQLLQLDPRMIVGLTMNPHRLRSIRERRSGGIRAARLTDYGDLRLIGRELRLTQALLARHGWRSIDVSYMATEEVASEIIDMISTRERLRASKSVRPPR